jgi:two-component system cell cycle sensor histidine kinase/response regulator CckA
MAEALLRTVERVARIGAWRVELPGFTSVWSDEVRAIPELPQGFVPIADEAIESYAPEDRHVVRAAVKACVEFGRSFDLEVRFVAADERPLWLRLIGEAVRNETGVICRIEGAFQDVTARRLAEDEARRLTALVAETLEHISDGFVTLDREWRFTFLNREAERQTGQPRDSLIGRVVWDIYPQMLGTVFETSYRHAMSQRETAEFEAWFEPLSSWFSVRAYPAPLGIAVYFYNITQQREAREHARISEERFRLLAHATNDAIWDTDLRSNTTWRSAGFQKLFGVPADGIPVADDWSSRIHDEDRERVMAGIARALDGNGDSWSDEYRYRREDGSVSIVYDRGYIIRNADGTPTRVVGGMSDLTERKKLEAQFLRAQRLESIGTLAGGIAHDLNNILSPILMASGLLKDGETSPDRLSLIDTIEVSGRRGSDMVRQVLAFARGVEGKRLDVDVRHLTREVQKILRETMPKNIDLQISAPVDLWIVHADATQLNQVLMNLCVNARDAMPDGGSIRINMSNIVMDEVHTGMLGALSGGPHVLITVADTGTGMSQETQERIFEPFFTTKEVGKGTGLGLSTVLTIVKSHGGAIDIQSGPGLGTTFKIYLPALSDAKAHDSRMESAIPRGRGELVLVVDDEEHIRSLTRKTLQNHGYTAVDARNGAEAVALYAQHRDVKAVLSDMAMPVMDGFAMIAALKALNPDVRVIAASGHSTEDVESRAMRAGAWAFISKPYTLDTLAKAVHDALWA